MLLETAGANHFHVGFHKEMPGCHCLIKAQFLDISSSIIMSRDNSHWNNNFPLVRLPYQWWCSAKHPTLYDDGFIVSSGWAGTNTVDTVSEAVAEAVASNTHDHHHDDDCRVNTDLGCSMTRHDVADTRTPVTHTCTIWFHFAFGDVKEKGGSQIRWLIFKILRM